MKRNLIDICNGRIRFEAQDSDAVRVYIVPLATFGMKMTIINEEKGEYKHFFLDDDRSIEVDGATWMEASDVLFDAPLMKKSK